MFVLRKNQLQKIHIQDYEYNPETHWIKKFKQNEGASAPIYDLQEFNGTEMFNATAGRSMFRYGGETRTHLEHGGLFEDYYVEYWKCGNGVF